MHSQDNTHHRPLPFGLSYDSALVPGLVLQRNRRPTNHEIEADYQEMST